MMTANGEARSRRDHCARLGEGAIEPVLQDRLDRAVGGGADIVAAPGRSLDALRSIAFHEAENAEARAEALLGMGLCLHDRLEQRDRGGADLLGLAQHACRRPFRITRSEEHTSELQSL